MTTPTTAAMASLARSLAFRSAFAPGCGSGPPRPEQQANAPQRDRSNSRRRSRSPARRDRRRSYDSRSRSRSRDEYRRPERRSRSPINGAAGGGGYSSAYPSDRGAAGAPQSRNYEDRGPPKDSTMQNVRESSQQDRRVYVGNLSYDVKWHHLKDFMRQGK